MSLILHGYLCPQCRVLTGSEKGWRPSCRSCGYTEPTHCGVCRSEAVVALCDEHGPRCEKHVETHAFCKKLVRCSDEQRRLLDRQQGVAWDLEGHRGDG